MKSFFGGSYIDKSELIKNNIDYPIRLEYYKIDREYNYKSKYGIEIIKTEYKADNIEIEKGIMEEITEDENEVCKILNLLRNGTVTPTGLEEIVKEIIA